MCRIKYSDKGNYDYTFGAVCVGPGMMRFRVWAPNVKQVCLEFSGQAPIPMTACEQGFHELTCACAPGARYRYRMDGALCVPDPASRLQDGDIHDASIVTDVDVYPWRNERSEEHTSELQSLMRISYAVFCLKKKKKIMKDKCNNNKVQHH